ncbi:ImpE family T6SS protein Cts1E [Enterobacteriaceae bacterium 4M9]|nr:ImpE family T6SS protein Cts1E [Enterobacteriaceae bacterium 4M9]
MLPKELSISERLKLHSLKEWIDEEVTRVKSSPGDIASRIHLMKLYCIDGDWFKATRQVETISRMQPTFLTEGELYKNLIAAEAMREDVFKGARSAGEVENALPEWISDHVSMNKYYHECAYEKAEQHQEIVLEHTENIQGNGEQCGEFSWITDGDSRLGNIFEFITSGGYRWISLKDIKSISVNMPQRLIDLVWAPATLSTHNNVIRGYVPARYPLNNASDQHKLGLITEWDVINERFYQVRGQKMWITSAGEFSLFETGEMNFECQEVRNNET